MVFKDKRRDGERRNALNNDGTGIVIKQPPREV
jgi:hypothetical protein